MSDWIRALGALRAVGASAGRIGAHRIWAGGSAARVPSGAAELTPAYLNRVLGGRDSGRRAQVSSVDHLGGHSGTTLRDRIEVHYHDALPSTQRSAQGQLPSGDVRADRFFAKLAPRDFSTALFVHLMGLGANEVRFYRDLARDVPVSTPLAHSAEMSADAVRFCILFEDLEQRGCEFRRIGDDIEAEFAQAVVIALARIHARYWQSPRFDDDLEWLPRRSADPHYPVARLLCRLAHKPAVRRLRDQMPRDFADRIRMIFDRREALEDAWAEPPVTLIHGDPHLGNLYLEPDGAPGFLDWQLVRVGQGIRDVAHFLITSLSPSLRREIEEPLLERYVETLEGQGVAGFGLERARAQYRLHTLYEWFAISVTAAAATLQPMEVVSAGLERAIAAIEDWNALDALAEL